MDKKKQLECFKIKSSFCVMLNVSRVAGFVTEWPGQNPRVTAQQNLVSWKTLKDFPESRVDTLTRRSREIQNEIE